MYKSSWMIEGCEYEQWMLLHVSYGIYLTWKLGIQTWHYDNVVFGMAPCNY